MSEDKIIAADDAALQKRAKLLAELSDITKAADEVARLREENARLLGLLREAHVKMEANNLWSSFAASRSRLYSGGREVKWKT